MKHRPHPMPNRLNDLERPPNATRIPGERDAPANLARTSPLVPHRRYPSLSDDGQPPMFSVRVVALVALVAIMLALALRG